MAEPWRTILTVFAGFGTGILSALFGVGGAVVSTPAIRVLGATAFEAVGTTLPSILPSAASGTIRYRSEHLIRTRVVRWTGAIGAVASIAGSRLSHTVPGNGHLLMIATAVLMAITGQRLARTPRTVAPAEPDALPALDVAPADVAPADADAAAAAIPWGKLAVIGVAAGGMSGLLGIGGGVVMVPAFTEWLGLGIKEAVGTSLACVAIVAVPGIITHTLLHDINWAYAIPLSIAVIPGARFGSHLAVRATERTLRAAVGIGLIVTAIVYAGAEILALR